MANLMRTDLLRELIEKYTEVGRITELILRVKESEREELFLIRGELIEKCNEVFQTLNTVHGESDTSRSLEILLREQMLSIITQDELLYSQFESEKVQIQNLLPFAPDRNRAASYYQLNSRHREF